MSIAAPTRPRVRHALATAAAYMRLNLTTGAADVIVGAQADFLLVDVYRDDDVRPGPGGRYQVDTADGQRVRFSPLARGRTVYANWYQHATSPDGRTSHPRAPMTGQQVHKRITRADGIHVLASGDIVRINGGRCVESWSRLPDTPEENR
ncbi:hypothetical protein OG497_37705 [Streptomyces sp. NBC_01242]|uniref:hypothetical protein n=1 Tax=Streptomyces sp. NBC_01242 TaxID=2903795 RepID=UPI00224DB3BB|nr:hypothetical protein [Streptomyces sp. NBC_01242]MCX4799594.1 hypothetical protein [Streptomyces sp. NBC_01242]